MIPILYDSYVIWGIGPYTPRPALLARGVSNFISYKTVGPAAWAGAVLGVGRTDTRECGEVRDDGRTGGSEARGKRQKGSEGY